MFHESGLWRIGRMVGARVEESPHEPLEHRVKHVAVFHVIEPAILLGLERVERFDVETIPEEEPSRTGPERL